MQIDKRVKEKNSRKVYPLFTAQGCTRMLQVSRYTKRPGHFQMLQMPWGWNDWSWFWHIMDDFSKEAARNMQEKVEKPRGKEVIVKTFHSFCAELIKDHAERCKVPGDFKTLSNKNSRASFVFIRGRI